MKFTIQAITENTPGVLYRIAGIFLRRKINLESLMVHEIPKTTTSEFMITLQTTEEEMEKVANQIKRIIEVYEVTVKTHSA